MKRSNEELINEAKKTFYGSNFRIRRTYGGLRFVVFTATNGSIKRISENFI